MTSSKPRWINEIPGIKDTGEKVKLTKEQKRDAKEFENAVKKGKIKEWMKEKSQKEFKNLDK